MENRRHSLVPDLRDREETMHNGVCSITSIDSLILYLGECYIVIQIRML
jgi:hypothetical protein